MSKPSDFSGTAGSQPGAIAADISGCDLGLAAEVRLHPETIFEAMLRGPAVRSL
jgi:hypothetical protein